MARPKRGNSVRANEEPQVSDKVLTVPNLISFTRLCLVPVFVWLLLAGHDIPAALLFALAAGTDWVDGQIARRTNQVSKLGQLLDPAVDRVLMVAGVVCLLAVGRLPLWIVLVVLVRDAALLAGGAWLLHVKRIRVPVVYAGKVATTLLFCGFFLMLLNVPLLPGIGVTDAAWLPGFTAAPAPAGIWLVYAGLALALGTTAHYVKEALRALRERRDEERGGAL